jgi:hypothetical protein
VKESPEPATRSEVRPGPTPRRPAAPRLLDPILATWERVDRRRRRIHPVRHGALLGVEFRTHAGPPLRLADGTTIRPGDPIGELHLDNARVREVVAAHGWSGVRFVLHDLPFLARWASRPDLGPRPIAFHAGGLLAPLAARAGFEVRPRRRSPRARLDEWYLRWLMGHWSPAGRARLARGHSRLRSANAWISTEALVLRYGAAPG